MHGWILFLSVFAVIFLAELPDKTALAAMVLATRHRPLAVAMGAATALTIQSVVAVAAGQLVSLFPRRPVHLFSGALFLLSALIMWRRHDEADGDPSERRPGYGFWRSSWVAFGVIFIAEWGDLTQIATAALAARYRAPYTVFGAATLALWVVAALAVIIGHRAARYLHPHRTKKIAAVLFALIGAALVSGLL